MSKIRILFVCHGNICRSPMAEFVMKDLVRKAGLDASFEIASAATTTEEIGNPVYPPARAMLALHGISCAGKTARKIRLLDYEDYDHIIGMDDENLYDLRDFFAPDADGKVSLLLDWTGSPRNVADPWYTRNFEDTYRDVVEGCSALLAKLAPSR